MTRARNGSHKSAREFGTIIFHPLGRLTHMRALRSTSILQIRMSGRAFPCRSKARRRLRCRPCWNSRPTTGRGRVTFGPGAPSRNPKRLRSTRTQDDINCWRSVWRTVTPLRRLKASELPPHCTTQARKRSSLASTRDSGMIEIPVEPIRQFENFYTNLAVVVSTQRKQ